MMHDFRRVVVEAEKTLEANGADGISDIEGKAARVAASKLGNERVSISRHYWAARWAGQPAGADTRACEEDGRHS